VKEEKKSTRPPSFPWKKGIHKEYTMASVEVQICQDNRGNVFSIHNPMTEEDRQILEQMPSSGLEQISHSLILEGLRRESYLQILLRIQGDPEFIKKMKNTDEEVRDLEINELSDILIDFVTESVTRSSENIVKEILHMFESQIE
jgi:hypothetical protein